VAGPTGHSVGLRGGVERTFSWEKCIHPTLLGLHEMLPCMGSAHRKHTSGVHRPA
jgi:hypothetical protein